jgi:Mn-dependent DtxR family transcriptional regulator
MSRTLDKDAVELLRAIFDLAEVDMRASHDLLGRLLDLDVQYVRGLIQSLRRSGMVQHDRLNLTMAGLAVAIAAAPVELQPMAPAQAAAPLRLLRVA